MQQQKNHSSLKGLRNFMRHFSGIFSKDTTRRMQAIQQSCDDLRQRGDSKESIAIFEDILLDIAEAVGGWPQYSSADDKKITTGFLAFNLVLLPLIYSWTKPLATPQIIALLIVIINIVFNLCSLGMLLTKEKFHVEGTGCLLSLAQLIFTIGTIIVIIAMLWYIFPPAVIVFLLASLVAFLIWSLSMVRGAIIAAHIRRIPQLQGNIHIPPTK